MAKIKEFLSNKGIAWYIIAVASVLALVVSIITFATWSTWLPNNMVGTGFAVLLLVGALLGFAASVFPVKFGAEVEVIIYTIAFGVCINKIANAIADQINDVHYTGGSFDGCMFYAITIAICAIACVVACFFPVTKDDSEKI